MHAVAVVGEVRVAPDLRRVRVARRFTAGT